MHEVFTFVQSLEIPTSENIDRSGPEGLSKQILQWLKSGKDKAG